MTITPVGRAMVGQARRAGQWGFPQLPRKHIMLNRKYTLACAAADASTVATPVVAQAPSSRPARLTGKPCTSSSATIDIDRLAIHYRTAVGSTERARLLIEGMGSGTQVALGETILAGTGKAMGYVNINIALALANARVSANAQTGEELPAHGFLSALKDVMQRRAGEAGWGQIAKDLGFSLDQVLSASNTAQVATRAGHASRSGAATQMA
jgi:hypothetical protein